MKMLRFDNYSWLKNIITIWVFLLLTAVSAWGAETKTLSRYFDPVEVPGDLLYYRFGDQEINKIRLYAYHGGAWRSIPFQIDERDAFGNFALPEGPQGSHEGENGKIDIQDILVFMAEDVGDRAGESDIVSGEGYREELRSEIEVSDPLSGARGWVYLLAFKGTPPPPASEKKVEVNFSDKFSVSSKYFYLEGLTREEDGKKILTNRPVKFWAKKAAGGDGENIIDRIKVRASASVLALIDISASEGACPGGIIKYKAGPIRTLVNSNLMAPLPFPLKYISKVETLVDSFHYERMNIYSARMKAQKVYFRLMTDAVVGMGCDFNRRAFGMKFANSANPQEATVDGVMSEAEKNMNSAHDTWRYYTGSPCTVVIRGIYDPQLTQYTKLKCDYTDDINVNIPPEELPGQIGYCYDNSKGRKLFMRWFMTYFHLYIPNNFCLEDEAGKAKVVQEINNVHDKPLKIKVGEDDVVNEVTSALPLSTR